jgi:hypothetical protein
VSIRRAAAVAEAAVHCQLAVQCGRVDPNMLCSLAINPDKKGTKEVQQAASFMLTHSDSFKRIESSFLGGGRVQLGRATRAISAQQNYLR